MKKYKLIATLATIAILLFQIFWIFKLYSDSQDRLQEELKSKYEAALISMNLQLINNAMKSNIGVNELYEKLKIDEAQKIEFTPQNTKIYECVDCDTLASKIESISQFKLKIEIDTPVFIMQFLDTLNLLTANKRYIENEVFLLKDSTLLNTISYRNAILLQDVVQNTPSIIVYKIVGHKFQAFYEIILYVIISLVFAGFLITTIIVLVRNIHQNKLLMTLKSDFTSNMTHELKTPLSTLSAAVESMTKYNVLDNKEMASEFLTMMEDEIERLKSGIELILTYSQLENQSLTLQLDEISTYDFVKHIEKTMHHALESVDGKLYLQFSVSHLYGDAFHLENVITNLINNSIKYVTSPVIIHITISEENGMVKIIYTDNGQGIPEEHHKDIFKPYFRIPEGNLHTVKGYGLGLAYVNGVISLHKGEIKLLKMPNFGIYYVITLPLNNNISN